MSLTRLLLVRHGDSHHKAERILAGPRTDRGLSDLGRAQAKLLGDRLGAGSELPVAVYASVLPRAVETAEIIAGALGLREIVQDCGLCTWHAPAEFDGMPYEEIRRVHGIEGGGLFRPFESGNETWAELVARAGRSLWTIAARHRGATAVVVGHAESVNASYIALGNLPLNNALSNGAPANTSITEWTTDGDTSAWPPTSWTLVRMNDVAHLDGGG